MAAPDTMGFVDDDDGPLEYGGISSATAPPAPAAAASDDLPEATRPDVPTDWTLMGDDDEEEEAEDHATRSSTADASDVGPPINEDDEDDDYDGGVVRELPPHACRYCGFGEPLSVAKCNTCKKWFCNNRGCTSAAHIVTHLVRSKHKEISLHPDGPLGDTVLECYVCGSKNIFLLGFIPSKQDSVVVLLCREPCLHNPMLRDMDWDPSVWLPLVEERQLLSWLVQVPPRGARSLKSSRAISTKQMLQLEDAWKTNPDATLDSLMREGAAFMQHLDGVPTTFHDGHHYVRVFEPLIEAEAAYSREMKENISYDNLNVRWEMSRSGRVLAIFELPATETKIAVGDELLIAHPPSSWDEKVVIVSIEPAATTNDEVTCELKLRTPPTHTEGLSVKFLWKSTTYDRMKTAMTSMAADETTLSAYLYERLLGHVVPEPTLQLHVPKDMVAPGLASLNHSQTNAVRLVLRRPLSLIQGPPGTGKTVTSATLVYHMCKLNGAQVLVCAPSNTAVDHVAERLQHTGLNVVRVAARTRESVATAIDHLMLHVQVKQFCDHSPKQTELRKLMRLRDEVGHLTDKDKRRLGALIEKIEDGLLANADVVACTCSAAADRRLAKYRFKHVLIDESTQSCEPECLIPLVMGCKQLVLVGDHCQMGPVILHRPAEAAGLGRSLFERLIELGERPIRLDVQYRMHPCLSEFSSNAFYEGTLQNGVTAEERDATRFFVWPDARRPMFFYNSISPEELSGSSTSYLNRAEAALAEKIVTHLIRNGAAPDSIGVITPYEGQRVFLINYMLRNGALGPDVYKRVEAASVDSFQGREKEFIVLTCVRSNEKQGIGFLSDWRRLNVALTRAKRGLVIIGNARVLSKHGLWHSLLTHFKEQGLIVDGPLSALKTMNIQLQKPRGDMPILPGAGVPATALPMAPTMAAGHRLMYQPSADVGIPGSAFGAAFPAMPDLAYVPGRRNYGAALTGTAGTRPASQPSLSMGSQLSQE